MWKRHVAKILLQSSSNCRAMFSEFINVLVEKTGLNGFINLLFVSGFPIMLLAFLLWYLNFTMHLGPRNMANEQAKNLRCWLILYNCLQMIVSGFILTAVRFVVLMLLPCDSFVFLLSSTESATISKLYGPVNKTELTLLGLKLSLIIA